MLQFWGGFAVLLAATVLPCEVGADFGCLGSGWLTMCALISVVTIAAEFYHHHQLRLLVDSGISCNFPELSMLRSVTW